jgi:type IX secretion system PorP/SprF family membrane protein
MGEKEYHINFTGVLRQHAFLMHDAVKEVETDNSTSGSQNNNNTSRGTPTNGEQVLLYIDSYIKQIKGAVGVMFLKDKNAEFDNIGFRLGYATKLRVRGGKLGIGLQLGFLNLKPPKEYYPIDEGDNTIDMAKNSETFIDFDMNFGLHYKAPNWYAGLSCSQLLGGVRLSGEKNVIKARQQLYITGGYIWELKTVVPWSVEPSVLIKSDFSTWDLDLIAVARYNGILWFGLSYQLNLAVAVLFGAVPFYNHTNNYLKGIELGLAYSFQTNKFAYKPGGSMGDFEILIRYGFNFYKDKPLTGYGSSRHLYKNQY